MHIGRSIFGFTVGGILLVTLLALGTWQVQRLQWKVALIVERAKFENSPVISLYGDGKNQSREQWQELSPYQPVRVTGKWIDGSARRLLGQFDGEQSGIHIVQAVQITDNGRNAWILWVDQGFYPNRVTGTVAQLPELPPATEELTIEGWKIQKKPSGYFTPTNQPIQNLWYSLSPELMTTTLPVASFSTTATVIDSYLLQRNSSPPLKPISSLPPLINNHLGYAITWFSLALSLTIMLGFLLWKNLIK